MPEDSQCHVFTLTTLPRAVLQDCMLHCLMKRKGSARLHLLSFRFVIDHCHFNNCTLSLQAYAYDFTESTLYTCIIYH